MTSIKKICRNFYEIFLPNVSSNDLCIASGKTQNAEDHEPWYQHWKIGLYIELSSTYVHKKDCFEFLNFLLYYVVRRVVLHNVIWSFFGQFRESLDVLNEPILNFSSWIWYFYLFQISLAQQRQQWLLSRVLKFISSEKATKFCKIFTNYLTGST